jgi:arylsulfatase A-like enzyme
MTETRPNIVFILMDNLGYGELGVYGRGINTRRADAAD